MPYSDSLAVQEDLKQNLIVNKTLNGNLSYNTILDLHKSMHFLKIPNILPYVQN